MNVFDFRQHIVNEYSEFTRSFTRIKADDIQSYVTKAYDSQKYWPEPLIQVNPNFKPGGTVQQLVQAGQLHPLCAEIFRLGKSESSAGVPLPLHTHHGEAHGEARRQCGRGVLGLFGLSGLPRHEANRMKLSRRPCDVLADELKVGTLELGLRGSRALAVSLATSAVVAITGIASDQEEEQSEPPQEMDAIA